MQPSSSSIVIIDTDENHLCSLTETFRRAGYHCAAFLRAGKAMEYIAKNPVALVITEVVMPELDGIEVLRALKRSAPDIPVIALCGSSQRNLYLHLMQRLGASATFPKPVAPPDILNEIERWVRKQSTDFVQLELPIGQILESEFCVSTETE